MKFWDKFNKKNQKKQWIINSIKRKSNVLKHNLFVDNNESKLKVIWLKNDNDIATILAPLNNFNYQYSYLINAVLEFNNINFNYEYDIVVLDLWWKVKELYNNVKPNSLKLKFNEVSHVIVLPINGISQLLIKINGFVRPMQKIL